MTIPAAPDQLAALELALLCEHAGQQRIGSDVERHAEEYVGTALVEVTGQLARRDVELEQHMAGRERHALEFPDVPGTHENAP